MADQQDQLFDLVVVGGGPAGYVGAIRASQLGMKVAVVERDRLGGVCLNWGCIPTKALLAGAELYHKMQYDADSWGINVENVTHNWEKVIGRSRGVADQLNKGVGFLFKKNKITHFAGHAFIPVPGKVQVFAPDDTEHAGEPTATLKGKNILIATGAVPRALPGTPFDGDKVIAAKEAMTMKDQPKKLLIVGSGAIGMEFAYFYNAFGTECTVIEMQDRVMPIEDADSSKAVQKAFKKQGINIKTGHITKSIEVTDTGIKATIAKVPAEGASAPGSESESETEEIIEADKVLVAIGVRGRYDGLLADKLGVELFKDHIKIDYRKPGANYETSVKGIYAVGDVIGPPWLAHVASEEAVLCVERMAGHEAPDMDYDSIPGCTYCHPQVASIGLTEQACKDQNLDYNVGTFPFQASGKAQALGETDGFVKMITGKQHGEILGCHMVGENVTELIAEMGLARRLEATAEEIINTVHAHPTLSEAVHEATLATENRTLNF